MVILFGYLGCFPGHIVHALETFTSFILAAVLALLGFIGLGICASFETGGGLLFFFTLLSLFLASLSSSIAIVGAVAIPAGNYTRRASLLLIVLLITYYKLGSLDEASFRKGVTPGLKKTIYYPVLGVVAAITYGIGAFLIKYVDIDDRFEKAFSKVDRTGMLLFILMETILTIALYFTYMLNASYFISWILIAAFLVLCFAILALIIKLTTDR